MSTEHTAAENVDLGRYSRYQEYFVGSSIYSGVRGGEVVVTEVADIFSLPNYKLERHGVRGTCKRLHTSPWVAMANSIRDLTGAVFYSLGILYTAIKICESLLLRGKKGSGFFVVHYVFVRFCSRSSISMSWHSS